MSGSGTFVPTPGNLCLNSPANDSPGNCASAGASLEAIDEAKHLFDRNVLTLGFARRFATYKRSNLLLHDPERLLRILTNAQRPVQLILAGKAHPDDMAGQAFHLATNNEALYTFSFLILLYFAAFSVVSARERRWFWATMPSKTFLSALAADVFIGTVLAFTGLPGLGPLPWWQVLAIFVFAMVSCLCVNDPVKVALIKWLIPDAVAKETG